MGETRDELEANGAPGMFLCGKTGTFVAQRCKLRCGWGEPQTTHLDECEPEECPAWGPEENPL